MYRGTTLWQPLAIGNADTILTSLAGFPTWEGLSALMDIVFGTAQGSILYRDASLWNDLAPGTAAQVLQTNGAGANPSWASRTAEFASGTAMVFSQSSAPTGWTKQTAVNDAGLRVVSGTVGNVAGTPFSTVFAQTAVGATTLTTAQMPSHGHGVSDGAQILQNGVGSGIQGTSGILATGVNPSTTFSIAAQGGGGSHTHAVTLNLAYTDVIIANKN